AVQLAVAVELRPGQRTQVAVVEVGVEPVGGVAVVLAHVQQGGGGPGQLGPAGSLVHQADAPAVERGGHAIAGGQADLHGGGARELAPAAGVEVDAVTAERGGDVAGAV